MKIDKCPHCGSTKGLYNYYTYHGIKTYYNFTGYSEDNMDQAYRQGGKRMYCQTCEKYVCNEDDFLKMEGFNEKISKKYRYTKQPKERIDKPIQVSWSWTVLGRMIARRVRR